MFFLLKKILNETRNFAVSFSESGKVFYFMCNRMKLPPFCLSKKNYGRKTAFIQKASNRLTREQNFLIIDWHCYIIITIVTKK